MPKIYSWDLRSRDPIICYFHGNQSDKHFYSVNEASSMERLLRNHAEIDTRKKIPLKNGKKGQHRPTFFICLFIYLFITSNFTDHYIDYQ